MLGDEPVARSKDRCIAELTVAAADDLPITAGRRLRLIGYLSFVLIGWSGLLVPSLIRSIEHDFAQSDAGLGVFYFLNGLTWAAGGVGGGFVTERLGRRLTLPLAAILLAAGVAALALAPSWEVFLLGAIPLGLGAGAIDGGVNGLFLELHPGRGGAINALHFFFSVGALGAPLVVGILVDGGIGWPVVVLGTAVVGGVVAALYATVALPSGRRVHVSTAGAGHLTARLLTIPLLLLAIAIGCYVAAEIGTSSWLVRFLDAAPLATATASLSLFWGGLAAGRLLASRMADRFDPRLFAMACALVAGIAGVGAVLVPSVPLSIALFALAGLAQGPIYPTIMAIGGRLHPRRSGAVSGLLTGSAVIGGLAYPPVIGFISVSAGIGVGLIGAGLLAIGAAVALLGAALLAGRAASGPEPLA